MKLSKPKIIFILIEFIFIFIILTNHFLNDGSNIYPFQFFLWRLMPFGSIIMFFPDSLFCMLGLSFLSYIDVDCYASSYCVNYTLMYLILITFYPFIFYAFYKIIKMFVGKIKNIKKS